MVERQIEWHPSEHGGSLGRHVQHDERSRQYRFGAEVTTPQSITHRRVSPILDQDLSIVYENVTYNGTGSCTGNASVGELGTEPLMGTTGAPNLDEQLALSIYSAATHIDGFGAPFPSNDRGSSGLAVAKVSQQMGFISAYQHCFSLNEMLAALQATSVIVGTNWYDSMDKPNAQGVVTVSPGASVRGGHEYQCIGVDVDTQLLEFVNSWGTGWGLAGHFFMSYDTVTRLLGEQGDVTVFVGKAPAPPKPEPEHRHVDHEKAVWDEIKRLYERAEKWAKHKGWV